MKPMTVVYPWKTLKRGQGFFVPTLDPVALRTEILVEALRHHINGKAYIGIKRQKLGVLFVYVSQRFGEPDRSSDA